MELEDEAGVRRKDKAATASVAWGLRAGDTLRSVRTLRLLEDSAGRTWLAVFPREDEPSGGVMAHLLPGESVEIDATHADGVTLRVAPHEQHESELRVPAYLVVAPLLPPAWTG